jgi:hypothetical protein
MKKGKRYLRNTVLGIFAATAGVVALNRLHLTTHAADTPQWWHTASTLGLMEQVKREKMEFKEPDLASLRDFHEISVRGNMNVEIIGASAYRVAFTPGADSGAKLQTNLTAGVLRIVQDPDDAKVAGTLTIETPNLTEVRGSDLTRLQLRGLQAQAIKVTVNDTGSMSLKQNQVAQWELVAYSDDEKPTTVQADQATLTAGSLHVRGNLQLRQAD